MTELISMRPLDAWESALAGQPCEVLRSDGTLVPADMQRWSGMPDAADHHLLVDPCSGPTLDVGCGAGRIAEALTIRGITALGLDVSPEAVRLARQRGASAVRRDVFGQVPSEGDWQETLLADGNIGIGGDPVRLLRRLRDLMRPEGTALVEVDGPGTGVVHDVIRLRVQGRITGTLPWSWVGVDAVAAVAAEAGFLGCDIRRFGGRHLARLTRREAS